ncbi:O-succinylbenzoic acid--CoA ligase, partial [Corynebacterium bovis]
DPATPVDVTPRLRALLHDAATPAHLIPRRVWRVPALPLTGPGKVDRVTVRRTVTALLDRG